MHRGLLQDGSGSAPPRIQICHRTDSWGGVGSLLPESLPFPAHAGAQVDLDVGARRRPPLVAPYFTPDGTGRSREGYPIYHGLWHGRFCRPLGGSLLPVLVQAMGFQQPRHQIHLALQAQNSLPLLLTKVWAHALNLPCICHLRVSDNNVVGLTHHPKGFLNVDMDAHTVKQPHQDIQGRLETVLPGGGNKVIIIVK